MSISIKTLNNGGAISYEISANHTITTIVPSKVKHSGIPYDSHIFTVRLANDNNASTVTLSTTYKAGSDGFILPVAIEVDQFGRIVSKDSDDFVDVDIDTGESGLG